MTLLLIAASLYFFGKATSRGCYEPELSFIAALLLLLFGLIAGVVEFGL